jgi:hypothetical protein
VISEAGGEAAVLGNSSGAVLALHAAAAGLPITKLALWEPPFMTDPGAPRRQEAYVAQLTELLDAGRRGDAMALVHEVGRPARGDDRRDAPGADVAGHGGAGPHPRLRRRHHGRQHDPYGCCRLGQGPRLCWTAAKPGRGQPTRRGRSPPCFRTHAVTVSKDRPTTWPGTYSPPCWGSSSLGELPLRELTSAWHRRTP